MGDKFTKEELKEASDINKSIQQEILCLIKNTFDDGYKVGYKTGYEKGQKDLGSPFDLNKYGKMVKNNFLDVIRGLMELTVAELNEIFGKKYEYNFKWLSDFSAEEITQKYNSYLKKKEKEEALTFKIGDEVLYDNQKGIVTREHFLGANNIRLITVWFGNTITNLSVKDITKTGKHYDQMPDLLNQLKDISTDKVLIADISNEPTTNIVEKSKKGNKKK